ncbi:MAG: DUF4884 domain-containing protein [Saprospiraceae bacterium]
MNKLIRTSLSLLVILSIDSCVTPVPISKTKPKNNKTYEIEYLFEQDGCKVYRFYDYGHYVYFTNCNNSTTSIVNDSIQIKEFNLKK